MDNEGRQAVINQSAGVYWGGLWLSNTYAWSASKSVKNHPVNLKKAKKQVAEIPSPKYSYNYGYMPSYSYQWSDPYSVDPVGDYYNEVELNLEDLAYIVGKHGISVDQGVQFADQFGIESFLELVDQAISGDLSLDHFQRVITNYQYARELLPNLVV